MQKGQIKGEQFCNESEGISEQNWTKNSNTKYTYRRGNEQDPIVIFRLFSVIYGP